MNTVRGIIWDIDGTLLDSNDAHAAAYEKALQAENFPRPYDLIRSKIGMGSDQLLPSLVGFSKDSDEGKKINKTKKKIFETEFYPHLRPFPKAFDLVEKFHRLNYKLAVGTSASKKDSEKFLNLIGIKDFIGEIVSANDIDQSKPNPDVVLQCIIQLGLQPGEIVMIGDTPYDIEAASKAGVRSIAFRCGGWQDEDLKGAIAIYDGPEHLFEEYEKSLFRLADEAKMAQAF